MQSENISLALTPFNYQSILIAHETSGMIEKKQNTAKLNKTKELLSFNLIS